MIKLINNGVYLINGLTLIEDNTAETDAMLNKAGVSADKISAKRGTMAHNILSSHNRSGSAEKLNITFDAMASHDITYVGIIQTAKASGLDRFPMPYVLTNCHNSLCAVGGTINEDDHVFGLSAAKKYGGIYVPAHGAVIHQYMREEFAACGSMILGSDSHTRYGALGAMAIGEGGPELVKQLLGKTYDIATPDVIAVYLTGAPHPGVGPQDVAIAIISAVFKNGFVKNKVLEFAGDGIANLSADYRIGIDVMTTETACLSSIWRTDDEKIKEYYEIHGRIEDYKPLSPDHVAYYDGAVVVELDKVEPMIAMPFHPSKGYTIAQLNADPGDILRTIEKETKEQDGLEINLCDKIENGKVRAAQGSISGCAGGTFENICAAADILSDRSLNNGEFVLSVYPASQPINSELIKNGRLLSLIDAGVVAKTAFCGPCFGAGDVPSNNTLSIRHVTRNFPSREGAKPKEGQIAYVALMDARSIAATAANGGYITAATDLDVDYSVPEYHYNKSYYEKRVYNGYSKAQTSEPLKYGPYIADWPEMSALTDNLLLKVSSVITDPVTTTDELIPSGEISSYRSNPQRFSEFALSRKDPGYVGRAKQIKEFEALRSEGKSIDTGELQDVFASIRTIAGFESIDPAAVGIGSVIFARKPGDGSAREQAASCQRVLGGWANIANEYATKRYRSNLINWGMLPFTTGLQPNDFNVGDYIFFTDVRNNVMRGEDITAYIINGTKIREMVLSLGNLTDEERKIILAGCMINHYKE